MDQSLRHIIRERVLFKENLQQAEKLFFNTGKLSEQEKQKILQITRGDGFTNFITNVYYHIYVNKSPILKKYVPDLEFVYNEVSEYHKNLFPIETWDQIMRGDVIKTENILYEFLYCLWFRAKILNGLKKLPSIFKRNTKEEIRQERSAYDMEHYYDMLMRFLYFFDELQQRKERQKEILTKKIFSSQNNTLDKMLDFIEESENTRVPFEHMDDVYSIVRNFEGEIVEDTQQYIIVEIIDNPLLLKNLGCNASWCFSKFASTDDTYYEYSTNGIVYWIMDKSNLERQWVLIGPYNLYNINNQPEEISALDHLNIDWSKLHFEVPA